MGLLEDLRAEVQRNPQNWRSWYALSKALMEAGHTRAAREAVENIKEILPDASSWISVGDLLSQLGDQLEATAAYRQATRLERDHALAYTRLGQSLLALPDVRSAILTLRVAVRLEPSSVEVRILLGEALEQIEHFAEALEHVNEAARLSQTYGHENDVIYRSLARLNNQLGYKVESLEAMRKVVALCPEDVPAVTELSSKLSELGHISEARQLLEDVSHKIPPTPESHIRLGVALAAAGDNIGSIKILREAIRISPDNVEAHIVLGRAYLKARAVHDAIVAFQAAVNLAPTLSEAHFELGRAFNESGQIHKAIPMLVRAAALDPDNTEIQQTLGEVMTQQSPSVATSFPQMGSEEGSFTGDLSVFALPEVLEFLLIQKATGSLRVWSNHGAGSIELTDGDIVGVTSPEGLDVVSPMVEQNLLTESNARQIRERVSPTDGLFAVSALVLQEQWIEMEQLLPILQSEILRALSDMSSWDSGQLRFVSHTKSSDILLNTSGISLDSRWFLTELTRNKTKPVT